MIVESPAKAKKLQGYADELYGPASVKVVATVGHWRGLPNMAGQPFSDVVNTSTWDEAFVVHKDDVAARLGAAIKAASQVILATDADREGEAIAWHIAQHFRLREPRRATYTEVTKAALKKALDAPRALDIALVEAQRARQVLDYLLGMELSRRLWRFGCKSAGRVQSAALRIVVDREMAIEAFKATSYWTVITNYKEGFSATLADTSSRAGKTDKDEAELDEGFIDATDDDSGQQASPLKEVRFQTVEEANAALSQARAAAHIIESVDTKSVTKRPPPPFTTATLQAAAARAFDWRPDRTAAVAQALYEAGLITYIRTDSVSLSDDAIADIRGYLAKHHKDLLPKEPQRFSDGKDAQGAHEAIRPTKMDNPDQKDLKGDERTLYGLIWQRTLVCQAMSAVHQQTTVVIAPQGCPFRFIARGTVVAHAGYARLSDKEQAPDAPGKRAAPLIPAGLETGRKLVVGDIVTHSGKTTAPSRFTTETLMAYLKRKGIGRPSSYATIFTTLFDRGYVKRAKRFIVPDELGLLCDRLTRTSFDVLTQEQFTAVTESALDKIAERKQARPAFLTTFHNRFRDMLGAADSSLAVYAKRHPELDRDAVTPHKEPCSACGAPCLVRRGRFGAYAQCTNEVCAKRTSLEELKKLKDPCPTCGGSVLEQPYRKDGKKAVFYRCENGDWKSSFKPPKLTRTPCPNDAAHGMLEEIKRPSAGGSASTRYLCRVCQYTSASKETPPPCPVCAKPLALIDLGQGQPFWGCSTYRATGCKGSLRPAPPSDQKRARRRS